MLNNSTMGFNFQHVPCISTRMTSRSSKGWILAQTCRLISARKPRSSAAWTANAGRTCRLQKSVQEQNSPPPSPSDDDGEDGENLNEEKPSPEPSDDDGEDGENLIEEKPSPEPTRKKHLPEPAGDRVGMDFPIMLSEDENNTRSENACIRTTSLALHKQIVS